MARRKNTAEAFEILAEIAREKEAERGQKPAGASQPAAEAPSNFRLVSREPLLKAPGGDARPKWRWKETPTKAALPPAPSREEAARAARPLPREVPVPPAPQAPAPAVVEEVPPKPERRQPLLARWCSERPRLAPRPESVAVVVAAPAPPPAPIVLAEPAAAAVAAPWSEMGDVDAAAIARPMRIELLEAREPPARFDPDPWAGVPLPGESRERARVSGGGGHPGPACAARGNDGGPPPLPKPSREPAARPERSPSMIPPAAAEPPLPGEAPIDVGSAEDRDGLPEDPAPRAADPAAGGGAPAEEERPRARPGVLVIGSGWLERAVEVRLSTALALGMSGLITIVLFLTYLKLPPAEDAALRNFMALAPEAAGASLPALTEAPGPEETAAGSQEAPQLEGLARPVPIWSPRSASPEGESREPGSLPPGGPPEAAAPPPDIRNIESAAEAGGNGAAPGAAAPAVAALAARESAGFIHRIQVRAKESMKGAQQIVDYLAQFGFDRGLAVIERDRHGDKNAEGLPLYTVFVGAYESREQALPELDKLKEETRRRPFQEKAAFRDMFHDALVVRRRQ